MRSSCAVPETAIRASPACDIHCSLLLVCVYACACMCVHAHVNVNVCVKVCVCVCVCKRERCEKMEGGSAENQEDRGFEGNLEKLYDHSCSSNS